MLNNWLKFKQSWLASDCVLCGANTPEPYSICTDCLADLPWQPAAACPQCALPSLGAQLCGACLHEPPFFDATYAVLTYDYPIDRLMTAYKYGNNLNLSQTFGALLHEKLTKNALLNGFEMPKNIDFIIPMPMHPTRLKERGFNQAIEIARIFDKKLIQNNLVSRVTLTPPQASLPLKERVSNIKGAFQVADDVRGKRIAIVDDVMTTGASLNELAKTLKKAGAARVECWVIARTLPHK